MVDSASNYKFMKIIRSHPHSAHAVKGEGALAKSMHMRACI